MILKHKSADIVLLIIYFLASLALSIIGYSTGEFQLVQRISNSYFTDKAVCLYELKFSEATEVLLPGNFLFSKKGYNIYGIYLNKGKFHIPIISGRTFETDDFYCSEPKAIVGKNVKTKVRDGKEYYEFNGSELEIIGIMGIEKESWLDDSVYISITKDTRQVWTEPYILDGDRVIENVNLIEANYTHVKVNNLEESGIARIFSSNATNFNTLFFYVGLMFFITIIVSTSFWVIQKQKFMLILKICGVSRIKILLAICLEYFKYAFASFVVGIVVAYFSIRYMFSYQLNSFNIFIFFIAGMICCIVPALFLNLRWANNSIGRYQQ
ncbi:MAG: hypothetical protein GXX10_01225 [Clostridiaceae bacterium]|nr:hypothetical protein [Clostridiaceae bacterium]